MRNGSAGQRYYSFEPRRVVVLTFTFFPGSDWLRIGTPIEGWSEFATSRFAPSVFSTVLLKYSRSTS
jgi:hypothetical protein